MGVKVDYNLTLKLNMKVNMFKRLSPFITMEMIKLFCNAYMLPHFVSFGPMVQRPT